MRPVSAFAKVGLTALVLGVIGGIGAWLWLPDWMPPAAGVEAQRQDTLYLWLLVTSSIIFAVVVSFLGYSMWKFRARPGDMSDGAPIHGHTGLEIIWTIVPIVIVLSFAVAATVVLNRNESLKHGHMVVNVTGKQFAWSFTYPKRGHLHTGILVLPEGRQVEFRLHAPATDVIHSFKIPALRVGEDVVPGTPTTLVATPTRLGTYAIVCAELCGIGHSQMREHPRRDEARRLRQVARRRRRSSRRRRRRRPAARPTRRRPSRAPAAPAATPSRRRIERRRSDPNLNNLTADATKYGGGETAAVRPRVDHRPE